MCCNNCSCGCHRHCCDCHRDFFDFHNRRRNLVEESSNIIIINSKNVNVRVVGRTNQRIQNKEFSNWY